MPARLQKKSAESLPSQISSILRSRIHHGEYALGSHLSTIRDLAVEFSVSTRTVIKALDILDEEGLIQRVPVKGTFVRQDLGESSVVLHACLAFPEHDRSLALDNPENWALNSELYRGLLYDARHSGIALQYSHFSLDAPAALFQKQLSELRQFDFIVFPGQQLLSLQEAIAEERPTFSLQDAFSASQPLTSPRIIPVDYDRADAEERLLGLLQASGCSSAAVIADRNAPVSPRVFSFLRRSQDSGISTPSGGLWQFSPQDSQSVRDIMHRIQGHPGVFLFCDASDFTCQLYEAAHEANLVIGRDLMMTGIASGVIYAGLLPRYTYLKIPRFEMGRKIIQLAQEAVHQKQPDLHFPKYRVELIQGESIKNPKEALA